MDENDKTIDHYKTLKTFKESKNLVLPVNAFAGHNCMYDSEEKVKQIYITLFERCIIG